MKRYMSLVVCFVLAMVILLLSACMAAAETITLAPGVYNVGKDISAGEYDILCIEASDPYNEYIDMMKSLSDDENLQAIWDFYGDLADEPTVTVTIRGASGDKKRSFGLEKNEKRTITLEDDQSIKIEDGTCTIEPKRELTSETTNDTANRTTGSGEEWICPNCDNVATGNFCNNCGTAKPENNDENSIVNSNDDITGLWFATHLIYNGVTIDISGYDMDMVMTLNADGSVKLSSNESEEEGIWSRDADSITLTTEESGSMKGYLSDNKITITTDDFDVVFSRELLESQSLPSPISAKSESEFYGQWFMSRVVVEGVEMSPLQIAGMGFNEDMILNISEGNARADINSNGSIYYNEFTTTFANGKLQLWSKIDNVSLPLVLTDSGEICSTTNYDGSLVQMYFSKQ